MPHLYRHPFVSTTRARLVCPLPSVFLWYSACFHGAACHLLCPPSVGDAHRAHCVVPARRRAADGPMAMQRTPLSPIPKLCFRRTHGIQTAHKQYTCEETSGESSQGQPRV